MKKLIIAQLVALLGFGAAYLVQPQNLEGAWKHGLLATGSLLAGQKFNVTEINDQGLTSLGVGFSAYSRHQGKAFGSISFTMGPTLQMLATAPSKTVMWEESGVKVLEARIAKSQSVIPGVIFGVVLNKLMISLDLGGGMRWVTAQYQSYPGSQSADKAPVYMTGSGFTGRVGASGQFELMKLGEAALVVRGGVSYAFGNVLPMNSGFTNLEQMQFSGQAWGIHGHAFCAQLSAGFEL